jgi:hypothetical protein
MIYYAYIMTPATRKSRFKQLNSLCLALPEATAQPQREHCSFLVRKKVFAYYLADHHGDGIRAVSCKVLPGDNAALIQSDPARFYLPAYLGPRGWVALRLDLPEVDWEEVGELVRGSYRLTAPKTLLGRLPQEPDGYWI